MKLLTYNVRGLGSIVKWREFKKLVLKDELDFICVQETKMEVMQMWKSLG